jgi:predicted TIM-barrel fold metal-dependent hydrolase
VLWGEEANPSSHRQSAFQWTCTYGDRPIMDTVASLIYHNLFGRFPDVRIASIENGSLWVPYLIKAMNKMNRMGRNGPWPGGPLTEKPSDILKRHVFVSPFHEEDAEALVSLIGPTQVLFGSDYPHAEGLAEPASYFDELTALPASEQRMIMRTNTGELLGLSA